MPKKNVITYVSREEYVEGVLPCGTTFLIDFDTYEEIKDKSVHLRSQNYLGYGRYEYLHRYIMRKQLKGKLTVDHINRNTFDNRKGNLRVVSQSENRQNRDIMSNNKSGHTNIYWVKSRKKWRVQIKRKTIGEFDTLDEAVNAKQSALT